MLFLRYWLPFLGHSRKTRFLTALELLEEVRLTAQRTQRLLPWRTGISLSPLMDSGVLNSSVHACKVSVLPSDTSSQSSGFCFLHLMVFENLYQSNNTLLSSKCKAENTERKNSACFPKFIEHKLFITKCNTLVYQSRRRLWNVSLCSVIYCCPVNYLKAQWLQTTRVLWCAMILLAGWDGPTWSAQEFPPSTVAGPWLPLGQLSLQTLSSARTSPSFQEVEMEDARMLEG